MSDLIRREDAIKALGECPLNWTDTAEEIQAVQDWECHKAAIEAVPSATDEEFEWCHDCKEYDQEKHCCHRWTKVIRQTVEELKADRPQGEWIRDRYWSRGVGMGEDYGFFYKCSLCEYEVENGYTRCGFNFCPYCGADMRGEEDETD